MKKLFLLLVLVSLSSCGIATSLDRSAKNLNWYPVEMRPSQVYTDGTVFYSQKLKNRKTVSVYFDNSLSSDAMFYRNQLWEQYGWTLRADGYATADAYAESPSLSTLHISIKRGVAIYLYPDGEFDLFRISKQ